MQTGRAIGQGQSVTAKNLHAEIIKLNLEISYLAQYPLLYCILCYLKTVLVIILQSCFHVNINNNGIFIKLIFCTTATSLAETKNTLSSAWALSTHFSSSTKKLMFLSRCWFFTCIKGNKKDTCTVTKLRLNSQNLFYFIFYFYLPHNNYKKYKKRRKKEVARRPNRNYRSLWEVRPPRTTG